MSKSWRPNNSLERTGDAAAEARGNSDVASKIGM
jgi:hypothetical protein